MTILDLLILSLATWRLTSLLSNEDGPGDVFAKIRSKLGVRYDAQSKSYGTNIIAEAVACCWCFSVWTAAFWTALYLVWSPSIYLALPFALSAGAIIIEECITRRT